MTTSPVLIFLTDRDRAELEAVARAGNAPLRSVQRAWIVLAANSSGDCSPSKTATATASPFNWRYTKQVLNAYLPRRPATPSARVRDARRPDGKKH